MKRKLTAAETTAFAYCLLIVAASICASVVTTLFPPDDPPYHDDGIRIDWNSPQRNGKVSP